MRKLSKGVALAAGLVALTLPGTAQAAAGHASYPGDWTSVRNVALGDCLDAAPENSTAMRDCDGSASQRWKIEQLRPGADENGVYRLRKNDDECAELVGTWAHAELKLRRCDPREKGQLFRARETDDGVYVSGVEHNQLVRAYRHGQTPFTSATLEWPGDHALWTHN
jgi:hypothetical protein